MTTLQLNPYAGVDWDAVEGHKAQLHTHTSHPPTDTHSGTDPPEMVIDDYRDAGYSVLAVTDHEYTIDEPTWPWTEWDRDPDELGMIAVLGVELGGSDDGIDHDLVSLFCDRADTSGQSIHEAIAAVGGAGGLAFFPHPSRYGDGGEWYVEYFRAHPHLLGVEVVNAADRYPTDRDVYDALLEELAPERAAWAFANDDYHGRGEPYTFDRSRNVLLVEELTTDAVREALVSGQFCYQHVVDSDPPVLDRLDHDAARSALSIEATGDDEIQWASEGRVVARGPRLDYADDEVGSYARARLVTDDGSETGTQPFLFG